MGRQVKERLGETQGTSGGSIWICSRLPESPGKIQQGCWKICEPTSSAEEVQCFSATCLPWGHCHGYSLAGSTLWKTQHECTDGSQSKENSVNSEQGALSQPRCLRPTSCSCHTQYIYSFIIYLTHWNECSLRIETAFFIRCCILYAWYIVKNNKNFFT